MPNAYGEVLVVHATKAVWWMIRQHCLGHFSYYGLAPAAVGAFGVTPGHGSNLGNEDNSVTNGEKCKGKCECDGGQEHGIAWTKEQKAAK
jgi:hypothetical protein